MGTTSNWKRFRIATVLAAMAVSFGMMALEPSHASPDCDGSKFAQHCATECPPQFPSGCLEENFGCPLYSPSWNCSPKKECKAYPFTTLVTCWY